jgi:hypothetical protein
MKSTRWPRDVRRMKIITFGIGIIRIVIIRVGIGVRKIIAVWIVIPQTGIAVTGISGT